MIRYWKRPVWAEIAAGEDYRMIRFPNNYGLSITRNKHSASDDATWEIAVVHFYGESFGSWQFVGHDGRYIVRHEGERFEPAIYGYQSARGTLSLGRKIARLPKTEYAGRK